MEFYRRVWPNMLAAIVQISGRSEKTDRELSKVAGLSHDTIHKARVIAEKAPPEVKEKLRRGETTINREYLEV